MPEKVKITECPRDAMRGIAEFIPTATKIEYINQLLKVGFDCLDMGSFVSPKVIPQMQDTGKVLDGINDQKETKLLTIVANKKGAEMAVNYQNIYYLGYPFSASEIFQERNTNRSTSKSLEDIKDIFDLCNKYNKKLVIYISMAFGNPYQELWNTNIVMEKITELTKIGVNNIALSDTIGSSNKKNITSLFTDVMTTFSSENIIAHLHTTPTTWEEKLKTAYANGCRSFDVAIKGFGGCPMAKDDLTGNMPTEKAISFFENNNISHNLNLAEFVEAEKMAAAIFSRYAN